MKEKKKLRLSGNRLKWVARWAETPWAGGLVKSQVKKQLGVDVIASAVLREDEPPFLRPCVVAEGALASPAPSSARSKENGDVIDGEGNPSKRHHGADVKEPK